MLAELARLVAGAGLAGERLGDQQPFTRVLSCTHQFGIVHVPALDHDQADLRWSSSIASRMVPIPPCFEGAAGPSVGIF